MAVKSKTPKPGKYTVSERAAIRAYLQKYHAGCCKAAAKARSAMRIDDTGKASGEYAYWTHAVRCLNWVMSGLGQEPAPAANAPKGVANGSD